MLRRLVRWIQPAFLLIAVAAIGWYLANQWPTLRSYPWQLDGSWLLATFLITLASWGVEIAIWRYLLAALGGPLPYLTAARLWFLSAIMRYVPGTVWQPLSLAVYSRKHGVSPEATITSLVLFQVVMLLAVAPILVLYFVWLDTKSLAAQLVGHIPVALIWAGMIPVLAFLLRPQWLVQLLNWGLARVQRPPLAMQLSSGALITLTLVSLFDWLLWGSAFAAFTFAVAGGGVGNDPMIAPLLVAAYPIANLIGFLAFITPSGFGVREGAFYLLLTPQIAGSVVTVIALGIRVWGVVNELLLALISVPFERAAKNSNETNEAKSGAGSNAEPLGLLDVPRHEPVVTPELTRARRRESM